MENSEAREQLIWLARKAAWLRVNQPFLESIRERLLNWRSQSEANQEQFREQGEALLAETASSAGRT